MSAYILEATTERKRNRNYIGVKGREVYYRIPAHQAGKKPGHPGCGNEGWTCCLCARSEFDCVCKAQGEEIAGRL